MRIFWLLLILALSATAGAQEQPASLPEDGVERLSLAALLIGDGNYERARAVLAAIDLDDPDLDRVRYHSLDGLVALNLDELARAEAAFVRALEAGREQAEPPADVIWLYLAQARFGQEDYAGTLAALDGADPETTDLPSVHLMRAQSHWQMGELESAWRVLSNAAGRFPDRAGDFTRQQVYLLVEQGLYQEAAALGQAFMLRGKATANDALAIGNALREAGEYDQALRILEAARLEDSDNIRLARVLAQTWLDLDKILPAADILHDAARLDPSLMAEAAELYRRAGWLMQALTLNARVIDQPKKLKQRLAVFIELGRFDQAAGMESDLVRTGLLNEEDIRYALAYALFKTGRYEQAESHLTRLTRDDLFRKANELRRAMEQCRDEPWFCT
ncbi:tetratricopeptide repeat protein [Wenzhouxiangella sp. XN201]|uniref:tetratricopeptide repeat protein n=1 Tax=Wenzhouxiangella sp. XN201 TaxID=2710755 RepID=UPI0013C94C9E|nr:tetratricopeptide repeat protein [Wenzhouxiangella sp. XN201]NEZ03936.1 tetratricopeptide repeat protein [Wenzhouxiangella sp. XN201]